MALIKYMTLKRWMRVFAAGGYLKGEKRWGRTARVGENGLGLSSLFLGGDER